MSGKVWCFRCCQKRKNRGQQLSRQKESEIHGVSQQTECIFSHVNDSYENGRRLERPEKATQRDCCNGVSTEEKEATGLHSNVDANLNEEAGIAVKGGANCVDKAQGSVELQQERTYQLLKQQLEAVQRDKQDLESQVIQANRDVRDLRHEIAVLQKRLQVAENRQPILPPPCPPPPPPLPPPLQPHVNPLRALLTIIQKRRNSRDPNHSQVAEGVVPEGPENTDIPHNHRCPGMNEVLEMIRNGVSLRHVIQVHKGTFQTEESESEPSSFQVVPELSRILKKRKVSADNHVSDGSCEGSVDEGLSGDPNPRGSDVPQDKPALRRSPGQCHLNGLCLRDEATQDTRGTDDELDEEQSDGDIGSTASTLPLTTPLDPGPMDLVSVSLSPESPTPPLSADEGLVVFSSGQSQMERYACFPPALRTSLKAKDCPVSCNDINVDDKPSCSNPTDESPVLQYLNWQKCNRIDLKGTLPFSPVFESVCSWTNSNASEVSLQHQQHQEQKCASQEVLRSDYNCKRFRSRDFGESVSNAPEDVHSQFVVLHDILKPQLSMSEEHQQHECPSFLGALSQDFLEESVDGAEQESPLPENEQVPQSPACIHLEEGESVLPSVFWTAEGVCEHVEEAKFDADRYHFPAISFLSVVEEERNSGSMPPSTAITPQYL